LCEANASFLSPPRIDSGDDDDDNDYAPAPEDWKKSPRVGDDFQVRSSFFQTDFVAI